MLGIYLTASKNNKCKLSLIDSTINKSDEFLKPNDYKESLFLKKS